jgi:Asp-tRNA(Asn)/Glu-tRNA(Gln) amidotransferase A subunit family amidase
MAAALAARERSSTELTTECLARANVTGVELGAFTTVCDDVALTAAAASDRRRRNGQSRGALDGVPVAIKDLQETVGLRTTYGCAGFAENVPSADAPSVARLRAAGAVIIGKTSTSPWGTLGETKHRLGPPARNPHDRDRTAGGSSGGSAAAVAAGIVPLATGTDSAGSVTAPAAFCGIVGVRGTRGLIPNPPHQDSLLRGDVGILSTTALDAALALEVMTGFEFSDSHSVPTPPAALAETVRQTAEADGSPLRGLRMLVAANAGGFPAETSAINACIETAVLSSRLGAEVTRGSLPVDAPMQLYMALYATDLRHALGSDLDAYPDDIFEETYDDLRQAPAMTAEQYLVRLNELWRLQANVAEVFRSYDLVVTPATAVAAFPHDQPPETIGGRRVRPGWASFMPHSVIWNMSGNPTASVPAGTDSDGLPLGCLIAARHFCEADIMRLIGALEL